jgi:hypothetical protein
MSYKIEITAETITELTGKLLALAAATQPDVASGAAIVAPIDTKPKRSGKAATSASTAAGTGSSTETKTDAAPAEPATPSADAGNVAAPATEQEPTTAKPVEPETPVNSLDFDKDVAPVVLNAVKVHTKEWVQEVLSQFGVARASQVPDEQLQELVDALKAGPQ